MIWVSKGLLTLIWYPDCYAATLLPQSSKYSKSADLLRKSLLPHVRRVPSSKALSCKHERLFDLLTLISFYCINHTINIYYRVDKIITLWYYLIVAKQIADGVWLSLVERYVRDVEVASSNLVTPTYLLISVWIVTIYFILGHARIACFFITVYLVFWKPK